jgi:hypothetical protein
MTPPRPQDYETHRRVHPMWHLFAFPVLLVNAIATATHVWKSPTAWGYWEVVVAIALAVAVFAARVQTLTVQDRVIRLEMGLRLREALPPLLAKQIVELTPSQLVGLRFAGSAELPALVERCLSGELVNGSAVKKQIREWQPDWLRA